ncbi:DNA-binding NarL/FixJ family response regulator [Streptosporangium becharense]|uniref:DNA-binding NarL/FixJ family response regulator n=1 Tax=Streptosporangium becharense TaxID=1816182 RepID=A0A7W9IHT0_9ACTN|nr:response regulator transcription factor [Streptosporangium becharense]MBB2914642.1 DNA-binding NarL/FixJ family response regulator [Streptosporangium becharense]MBB5820957.1 DNA-binding NarL/FixJ family response regulator [Streptosporangium becharense]
MTIRVLIADDQGMVRTGFTVFLDAQPDIEVVGEAVNGREAIERIAELRPDVVLMDVRMPVMDGLAATREILSPGPREESGERGERTGSGEDDGRPPKILILTTFDLDDYVYEALRAGASGFLLKDASAQQLAEAVRVVAAGEALLAPSVTRRLIAEFARVGPQRPRVRLDGITERETEVLVLIAKGRSNQEIAEELVLSEQTVKTHIGRILAKLNLRDRAQAIVYAYESGLVRPGE